MTSKPTSLAQLMDLQDAFMVVLGILPPPEIRNGDEEASDDAIREAVIGMVVEAAEAIDELNKKHRPWTSQEPKRVTLVIEETIDVLFYILEIFVLLRLSGEQIEQLYVKKLNHNIERILQKSKKVITEEQLDAIDNLQKLIKERNSK